MLQNLCFAIVRRLFTCGCKSLWRLSQSRPAASIQTGVQAWRRVWSWYWRHRPQLRIVTGRALWWGAFRLSHWGYYVTPTQHWLKAFCCIVYGRMKGKVAWTCELCSALGPGLNNPSPCPATPLAQEVYPVSSYLKFSWPGSYSALDIRKPAWNPGCAPWKVIFWIYPIVLALPPLWSQRLSRKEGTRNLAGFNSP